MREISLAAELKEGTGKGPARRARAEGLVPAVIYGPEVKPQSLVVNRREFSAAMKSVAGTNAIFNVKFGKESKKAVVRDLQRDPVTSHVTHIDFHAISMTKPMHIAVPIHFDGTPEGVKTDGGIMQTNLRAVEISCLPADLPDFISIDVSNLGIGESIHVKDIDVPNATILTEDERTIVVIAAPTVIKTTAEEGAEGVEGEEGAVAAEGAEAAEGEAEAEEKKEKKEKKEKE